MYRRTIFTLLAILSACSEGQFSGQGQKKEGRESAGGDAPPPTSLHPNNRDATQWEGCCPYHVVIEDVSGSEKKAAEKINGIVEVYTRIKPLAFHGSSGSQTKIMKIGVNLYKDNDCKTLVSKSYADELNLPDPKSSIPMTSSIRKLTVSEDGKQAKGEQSRLDVTTKLTYWEPVTYEIKEGELVETVTGDASNYVKGASFRFTTQCRMGVFKPGAKT